MPDHSSPLPDELESVARLRHRVASGDDVGPRRRLNWPAGTVLTDDPVAEEVTVDLSAVTTAPSVSTDYVNIAVSNQQFASGDFDEFDFSSGTTVIESSGSFWDFNGVSFNQSLPTLRITTPGLYSILASCYFDEAGQPTAFCGTYRYFEWWESGFSGNGINWGAGDNIYSVIPPRPGPSFNGNTLIALPAVARFATDDVLTFTASQNATNDYNSGTRGLSLTVVMFRVL